jgi:hypothetical protein
MRVDPIHVRERTSADVVIDTDEEPIFQTAEPGSVNAVAFQQDGRLVVSTDVISLHNLIREGKRAIDARHAIVQHNVGMLSQRAKNLAAGQGRSDRVTIRPSVRREHEAVALLDLMENINQHRYAFPAFGFAAGFILFFARASSSSTRAFSRSERSRRKYNSGARLRRNRSTNSCLMYSLAASNPSRLRSAS